MRVNIALLADPNTGGWPSFTAHLIYGLADIGYSPLLFRIGNTTERKGRPFGRGLNYHNVSIDTAIDLAKADPTIIAAVDGKHTKEAETLLKYRSAVVIHDPTELKNDVPAMLAASGKPVIIDRKKNAEHLPNIKHVFQMLHPYRRAEPSRVPVTKKAVAFSRIDWDKNTHIIVEANTILPEDQQVTIYGNPNTIYMHHKINPVDPDWKRNYRGGWPARSSLHHAVRIAQSAEYCVDLSVIKGDGGGTQYSFLEALDAEKPLIIHNEWLTGDPDIDEIKPAVATTVNNAKELASAIQSELTYDKTAAEHIFNIHNASTQAKNVMQLMENL